MDHRDALKTQAAERYLLGELPAEEAEEFELHYFECQLCAGAVESGEMFISAARAEWSGRSSAAVRPEPRKSSMLDSLAAFWRRPAFGLAAVMALLVLIVYQNTVEIPRLQGIGDTLRPLPAVQLLGVSRGEETVVVVPQGSPFVSLAVDIPSGTSYPEYICVLSRGGQELSSSPCPAPSEGQPITVLIPSKQLTTGSHELFLFGRLPDGKRSDRISTSPFTVEFR